MFPDNCPFEAVAIDILGPLPRTRSEKQFLLAITDHFRKLTQVTALAKITDCNVAVALCEVCVFKYEIPVSLLSDIGPQFASKLFQSFCRMLGITNAYTSTYHLQTNGQMKTYNRALAAMLRNYASNHHDDWDEYAPALTYMSNSQMNRSISTKPINLVLSMAPSGTSRHHEVRNRPCLDRKSHAQFLRGIEDAVQKA